LSVDTIAVIGTVTLAAGVVASYGIYRATRPEPHAPTTNKGQAHQTSRETPLSANPQRRSEGHGHPSLAPDVKATAPSASTPSRYIWNATPVRQNDETLGDPSEEERDHTVPPKEEAITFNRFMDLPPELRGHIASFIPPGELTKSRVTKALDDVVRPHMQILKIKKSQRLSSDLNTVVSRFSNVKHLDLRRFHDLSVDETNLSDADCEQIAQLTNLRYLDLGWCGDCVSIEGLKRLEALTNLENLDIGWCWNVTDAVLERLKALTKLRNLDISHLDTSRCSLVTDGGLEHLKILTNLEYLDISSCSLVTDGGLEHLKALTNLESLYISSCKRVTDASFEHLKALPNLRHLCLDGHTGVTVEGIAKFRRERPQCQVHIY
jgi:hypothetical protein